MNVRGYVAGLIVLPTACAAGRPGSPAHNPAAVTAHNGGTDAAGEPERLVSEPDAAAPPKKPVAVPRIHGPFASAVEKGFAPARKLALSSGGQDAAEQSSLVLSALADAIETIDGASKRVPKEITEVRFEAKRLRRSDRMTFSLAHWIREGLSATVSALEGVVPREDLTSYWIAQARASITAIDPKSGLTFQRAAVQDAVRTTLDTFTIVGQGLSGCPSKGQPVQE